MRNFQISQGDDINNGKLPGKFDQLVLIKYIR